MSYLSKITSGKVKKKFLILLYGPEKVGKTTFGAGLPKPLFICGESGTDQLDVHRIKPANWVELKSILRELSTSEHEYETVNLDTIDWLEQLQLDYLRKTSGIQNIRQIDGGYGAYKSRLKQEWLILFDIIDKLREKMNVCFLAHTHTKRFSDPVNSCEYDKYELKMEFVEVSAVFKEYVDAILFANFETTARKEKSTNKTRAFGDNTRVLYAERTHAFDAGNRYGMPAEIEFSANSVLKYVHRSDEDACLSLMKQIADLKKGFTNESYLKMVNDYTEKNKSSKIKLQSVINKLKIKLANEEGEENE